MQSQPSKMSRVSPLLKRGLIFVHRWLGMALCLVLLMWFASGVVLMYSEFPSIQPEDRLNRSPRLDAAQIRLTPAEGLLRLGITRPPSRASLTVYAGRPLYVFGRGRDAKRVYADTGDLPARVTVDFASRVASAWSALPVTEAIVQAIEQPDQWTVQGPLRSERPLWKFSWPNGEQVYVSGVSGEVVQYTTRASRLWAYFGAVPHWLYFTPLRKYPLGWTRTVIWASGAATIVSVLGLVIGVWMFRFKGDQRKIPYRGQKYWHMILGLIFGTASATWAFSGMLSMDPFGPPRPTSTDAKPIVNALRGRLDATAFSAKSPRDAIQQLAPAEVKELELVSIAGEPMYLATVRPGDTWIVPVRGSPAQEIGGLRVMRIIEDAIGRGAVSEISQRDKYDAFYRDRRHRKPLPVILVRMNDADQTRFYIDPRTGRLVGSYNPRDWTTRWLYHGLHSFDFPWLYDHRPLWDIAMIVFLFGGTALSVTSALLAIRVMRRMLFRRK